MLVSVVMPTYNGIQFLQESINSILNQTHCDFEFIILDDCSTEPVFDLIQSYDDSRIIAFRNPENIGLTKSLNICLNKAQGDFIVRHDGDDISLPNRIEEQLKFFEEGVGFTSCWYNYLISENNEWNVVPLTGSQRIVTEDLTDLYTKRNCGCDAGTIYSKEAIRKIGYFDERCYLGQTYNYNRRIQKFFKGVVVPEALYLFRQWENQVSKRAKILHPEFCINWHDWCNKCANEKPIIAERSHHSWED